MAFDSPPCDTPADVSQRREKHDQFRGASGREPVAWRFRMTRILRRGFLIFCLSGLFAGAGIAQVITSISPSSTAAGSAGFILAVNGSGFDAGAVVQFNGEELETVPVSGSLLKALVLSSYVTSGGKYSVTVVNSDGSVSNSVLFTVTGKSGPPPPPPPISGVVTVTISAPSQHLTLCSPVKLSASATTTSKGADITRFVVTDQNGNQLYSLNGVHSISPVLSLAAGPYTLTVEANDSAGVSGAAKSIFTVTDSPAVCGTKPPPAGGPVVSVRGCGYSQVGFTYEAVSFTVTKAITLPFDGKLFYGPGCVSTELADEIGMGQDLSFDADSYIFWFGEFPDNPNTSGIWTIGTQSSGCINYSAVPAC
jgi:hypothetical protein